MHRRLEEEFPYLILDARYEKVRKEGVIRGRAVLVALGVDWEGRRQVLAVELANRESATSWKEFLLKLKSHGLRGVTLAITDDHAGLKRSLAEVLPEAFWQRCYVHFFAQRPGLFTSQSQRRLLNGITLVLRSTQRRGGPPTRALPLLQAIVGLPYGRRIHRRRPRKS